MGERWARALARAPSKTSWAQALRYQGFAEFPKTSSVQKGKIFFFQPIQPYNALS